MFRFIRFKEYFTHKLSIDQSLVPSWQEARSFQTNWSVSQTCLTNVIIKFAFVWIYFKIWTQFPLSLSVVSLQLFGQNLVHSHNWSSKERYHFIGNRILALNLNECKNCIKSFRSQITRKKWANDNFANEKFFERSGEKLSEIALGHLAECICHKHIIKC